MGGHRHGQSNIETKEKAVVECARDLRKAWDRDAPQGGLIEMAEAEQSWEREEETV